MCLFCSAIYSSHGKSSNTNGNQTWYDYKLPVFFLEHQIFVSQRTSANWVFMWILNVQPCDLRREKSNETAFSNCGYFASVKKTTQMLQKHRKNIIPRMLYSFALIFSSYPNLFVCKWTLATHSHLSLIVRDIRFHLLFGRCVFFFGRVPFLFLVGNRHLHKNFEPTVWLR